MKRAILVVLLLAGTVGAQSANVIELRPGDADRAKKSWEALQLAQADWESVQKSLAERYAMVKSGDADAGNTSVDIRIPDGTSWSRGGTMFAG